MRTAGLVVLTLIAAVAVQAADPDASIREAEKSWSTAVTARDFAGLEKILGEKLIYAHSTGNIESREEYLNRMKSGVQKYESITQEKIRIVSYGDSVITHQILRMKGTTDGKPFNDHLMALHVWEKVGGSWRLAAHQTTKLPN